MHIKIGWKLKESWQNVIEWIRLFVTKRNSTFKALESILYLRKEILKLIQNANSDEIKQLLKIKNDIKYIFSIGFLKDYPLLFHFASLMDYLQTEGISCVESIVVVEYFFTKLRTIF